jgi:subtilisin family serine protease
MAMIQSSLIQKLSTTLVLICCIFLQANAQSENTAAALKHYYSYTPDGKTYYSVSSKKILVKFNDGVSLADQQQILSSFSFLKPLQENQVLPSPKVCMPELQSPNVAASKLSDYLLLLNQHPQIRYANPFLEHFDGTLQGIQESFFVKLKSPAGYQQLSQEAKAMSCIIKKAYPYDPLMYLMEVDKNSAGNALQMANHFSETGKFAAAEPDFLLLLKRFSTNDTYLNYQWSLNNTGSSIQYNGTPGADMNVFNAWTISTGNSTIKVAVIDEGVDLAHPDLLANMLPGFDATGLGSAGGPLGDDAHGTACAGIIAGVGNNNLGVAGVAYNSKIVPVRIAYSSGSSWVTSNAWIGTSIDWAWDQGDADVLSNSWGGGSSSSLINDAIGRATTLGRGGLGSPVLFAAGNGNGAVSYPATLQNVISVTAMSMCNQRKSPTSCDGESFWGSDYGVNTDISAPGVKIYTCDISGSSGYSTGDYTATFNGTSSATPNAAGVMALILSVNPSLSMTQARQIIELSCDKVGGYTYTAGVTNQPNGTWSNDLGYGRVNAFSALQLANPQPCTNPPVVASTNASPNVICSPATISLSLSGILFGTGQTYQWQSSPNNTTYTPISGATNSSYSASVSSSTWFRCVVTCVTAVASTPVQVVYNNPTINTFPYTENFDATSGIPCGWTVVDANSDGYTWSSKNTNSRSAANNLSYSYNPSSAANDWAFTPPLNMVAGTTYRIKFWYRVRSGTYPESMELRWGTSASAAGMYPTTIYTNNNFTNTTYLEAFSGPMVPSTSGIYYIGFKATSIANMWDIHIDDITIETIAPCTTPLVGGTITGPSTATSGVNSTFTLSGNTGTAIQWEQSVNAGVSWTNIAGATSSTASINLPPGTIQLRARSSASGSSCVDAYSNVLTVTVSGLVGDAFSNPIIVTLPFTQAYSNAAGSGYTSTYTGTNAQASPDIFFRFTTGPCTDSIKLSTCGSLFDTYIHLLNASGTQLASNDDNGPYCSGLQASIKAAVLPNTTYYGVFEGYSTSTGTIQVNIEELGNAAPALLVSAGGPTTFCQGGQVVLSVAPSSNITWSTGATTPSITVNTGGTYFATYTNGSCTSTSNSIVVVVNALPVVTASNVSGCAATAIALSGSPAGGTFSVPNPYTGPSTTYTYSFTNSNGCSATSAPASITVNPLPVVTASNVSGCAGTAIALSGSPAGGTFSVPNPYTGPSTTYTYSFTNSNGCSATSAPASITVNALPVVTASNVSGCAGTAIVLSGSPAGGSFNKPNPYTGPSTTYTYSFTNSNGCSSTSAPASITVNPLPVVTASNVSGCAGTAIALSGSPAGGTFSVPNPYNGPSTTYTYSFTNSNGCSSTSALASITTYLPSVHAPQTATQCTNYVWPVNGVTYTNSGTYTAAYSTIHGCDSSYQLQLSILNNSSSVQTISSGNTYFWPANGITYNTSGVYTHTLINSVGCDSILTLNLTIVPLGISVQVRAFLSGPYVSATGLMHDSLREQQLIPLSEPYTASPFFFPQISYPSGETTTTSVLSVSGPNAIVDWVVLELRSASNPAVVVATKRALIQRDGDVVDHSSGSGPVVFSNQAPDNYFLSIKHRNHLGVMTATSIPFSSTTTVVDFSTISVWTNPLIANAPRKAFGNIMLLHSGDVNVNKNIKYNGFSNDKDAVLNAVGLATPNNSVTGYRVEDANMDARIKYNNTNSDRVVILNSVGASTPNSILFQHTPN